MAARELPEGAAITRISNDLGVPLGDAEVRVGNISGRIQMVLGDHPVSLHLVPSGLYDPEAVIRYHSASGVVQLPVPAVFEGAIDDLPGSGAFLAFSSAGISGIVFQDSSSGWKLEPRRSYDPSATLAEVVATSDAVEFVDLSRDTAELKAPTELKAPALLAQLGPQFEEDLVGTATRVFRIQPAADSYYLANLGNDAQAVINRISSELAYTRMWLQRDVGITKGEQSRSI